MHFFRSLGVAGWAFRNAFAQMGKPRLWVPFLAMAAAQLIGLGFFLSFHRPGISALALPLVTWVGGTQATHYPFFYAVLPAIFSRYNIALGIVLGSITTGAATLLFARAYGREVGAAWAGAGRRYVTLFLVAVVAALLSLGGLLVGRLVPAEVFLNNQMARWSIRFGLLALFVILQSLFIYATAWVVLDGRGFLSSLGRSVKLMGSMWVSTLAVMAIPVVMIYPFEYLTERADLFLFKFRPEMMTVVLVVRIVVEVVLSFLLVGAVTRLYLWRREEVR